MYNHEYLHYSTHLNHKVKENEVFFQADYKDGKILIKLIDKHQRAPELEASHEKELHVIVVNNDLSEYKHFHPEKIDGSVHVYPFVISVTT